MTDFSLHPFPGQDSGGVIIHGAIERTPHTLLLSFFLQGNMDDIVLPAETVRKRGDNLWQATCFEMFWAEEGQKNYRELNLSPNGDWNVYAFTDYRTGMCQEERIAEPLVKIKHTAEGFSLTAELEIGNLHAGQTPLRVGVSAVLKHRDARLGHWALVHLGKNPDFHEPKAFLLRV
ncbi:MAG TPA: hypothetical protein DEQ20_11545 [Desulfobulbaceae bacterium]|nr:MAG: hypothetical protein A2520_04585 [Deltaproteobacteria bacterium RIFOXYD12_FULL_53_23]HCC55533.1 hypothetical protein [Desulfobulbaceae bacterium]